MSRKPNPAVPDALSISAALKRSTPLANLRERLRESEARFAAVRPCLPSTMLGSVKPGQLDADGWTLITGNSAVAAKLRQLEPLLMTVLRDAGWSERALRIKIQHHAET